MGDAPKTKLSPLAAMWIPAEKAIRHHWAPLLLIQVSALALVLLYFNVPSLRLALMWVENVKQRGGLPFAFCVGATAGGIIPALAKAVTGQTKRLDRGWWLDFAISAMVYGIVGLEVVIFYQYQTIWFGSGGDWLTLAKKTAVDMFIFSPLVSIPTAVVILDWRGQGFRFSRPKLGYFLQERLLSSMLLCWMFWIPVLLCVYSFPTNLQFPVSNLAEAAWAMVFVFFNAESA